MNLIVIELAQRWGQEGTDSCGGKGARIFTQALQNGESICALPVTVVFSDSVLLSQNALASEYSSGELIPEAKFDPTSGD